MEKAIRLINKAIKDTLKREMIVDGGKLAEVKTLVIGGQSSGSPKTPAILVTFDTANLVPPVDYLRTEKWAMPVELVSVVYSTDPEKGYEQANSLVLRAKSVLVKDRTLGFGHGTFFNSIRALKFDGNNPYFRLGNLYSAAFTCSVYFTVIERSEQDV